MSITDLPGYHRTRFSGLPGYELPNALHRDTGLRDTGAVVEELFTTLIHPGMLEAHAIDRPLWRDQRLWRLTGDAIGALSGWRYEDGGCFILYGHPAAVAEGRRRINATLGVLLPALNPEWEVTARGVARLFWP